MLKMYQLQNEPGSSPEFWEENWEGAAFEDSVRFMAIDPLRPLFEEYLRSDSFMLEGGCGQGNYLSYYSARGFNVIGIDFAQRALRTLSTRQPRVKLCASDVSELPFADKTFDLYHSGGVVEHFEAGPNLAIAEARRVLKDDGILLISVPYYSPLRRILAPFRKREWRAVPVHKRETIKLFEGKKFFQYAYRRSEFESLLASEGLITVKTQPYAVLWGLYEIPLFNFNGKREFPSASEAATEKQVEEIDVNGLINNHQQSLLKRIAVSEDRSVPVLGLGVELLGWAAANMMMYVCKPRL
jgi:SAM-dependent methyltransferase